MSYDTDREEYGNNNNSNARDTAWQKNDTTTKAKAKNQEHGTIYDFPPSQRQFSGLHNHAVGTERGEEEESSRNMLRIMPRGGRLLLQNIDVLSGDCRAVKTPSSSSTIIAEDARRHMKRKLLEMDDWTGAKTLAAQRPPVIQFPQHDDRAPAWGWGGHDLMTGQSTIHPPQSYSSYDSSSSGTFSVKRYAQKLLPAERETLEPSRLWPRQVSSARTPYGETISENRERFESLNAFQSSAGIPPVSPLSSVDHRSFCQKRPTIRGRYPLSQRPRSPQWQQLRSPQIAGSQTSPYFVEDERSTYSDGRSMITDTPSKICGTLSKTEQQRFESEGLAILSPSDPATSSSLPDAISEVYRSRLPLQARLGTPSSLALDTHSALLRHRQSPCAPYIITEASSRSDQPTGDQYAIDFDSRTFDEDFQEAISDDLHCLQSEEAAQIVELRAIDEGALQKRATPTIERSCSVEHVEDAVLFAASRVDIRAIPDWNDGDDPIEDSENSDKEAMQEMLGRIGKSQRQAGRFGKPGRLRE
ncbi:MAG: hypothetical protein SEPTF4163_000054 [Sporothrix epigloea]